MNEERRHLYNRLEELHREQRGWQRLIFDEELDYTVLNSLSIKELKAIIKN